MSASGKGRWAAVSREAHKLVVPLGAYAASRVVTFLALGLAAFVTRRSLRSVITVWDGRWYERIALGGYPTSVPHGDFDAGTGWRAQSEVAFFPLYPMVVRGADRILPGSAVLAGVVVALVFGALATVLVWMLARHLSDQESADRTAVLFAFFPGAFVFSLLYSEPLMLALAAACLLALLDRRWLAAGAFGAAATAARPNAIALAAACAWAAVAAIRERREWRALVAPVLAPLGMAGFFAFLWWRTGEPFVWFRVERQGWGERMDFGRGNLEASLAFLRDPFGDANRLVVGLGVIVVAVSVVFLVRARFPAVLNVYTAAGVFLVLASQLNARPRFLLTSFPLVMALGRGIKGRSFPPVVAASAASLVMLTVFYALRRASYYP